MPTNYEYDRAEEYLRAIEALVSGSETNPEILRLLQRVTNDLVRVMRPPVVEIPGQLTIEIP